MARLKISLPIMRHTSGRESENLNWFTWKQLKTTA